MSNKIIIFNSFYFLLNNNNFYLFLILKNKKILLKVNKFLHVNVSFKIINFINLNSLKNFNLNYFFFSWKIFILNKLKLRHKISWLKFFRKKVFFIKLNYGFSYNIFFNLNNVFLKKKKKYLTHNILFFWNLNLNTIKYQLNLIKKFQSLNQYTMRGYRFSKQKFIKRVGKISKYTEFKSKIL